MCGRLWLHQQLRVHTPFYVRVERAFCGWWRWWRWESRAVCLAVCLALAVLAAAPDASAEASGLLPRGLGVRIAPISCSRTILGAARTRGTEDAGTNMNPNVIV